MIIYQQMMIFLSTLPYRDCRAPSISSLLALKNNYYNKRLLFLLSTEEARELLGEGAEVFMAINRSEIQKLAACAKCGEKGIA